MLWVDRRRVMAGWWEVDNFTVSRNAAGVWEVFDHAERRVMFGSVAAWRSLKDVLYQIQAWRAEQIECGKD